MTTETQTTMDAGTGTDRTIEITCTPTLIWYDDGSSIGATATYRQTGANPPSMNGRVTPNGNIRLDNMPAVPGYNDNVDITIVLDTSQMKDQGRLPVAGRWATGTEGPVYNGKNTGFCWFCAENTSLNPPYDPTQPITITNMSAHLDSDGNVVVNDDTPDSAPDYGYCLGLVLPDNGNYFITLDPMLGSKGNSNVNAFMLKD